MKLIVFFYIIIVFFINSAGQYRDTFYDADRDFSIINPIIIEKKAVLERVFNNMTINSKYSEITLVISISSSGSFKVNSSYPQKITKSDISLFDSVLSEIRIGSIKRNIDTKVYIIYHRTDSIYVMKKNIEVKYFEERNKEETISHLNRLFQQYSVSLQNRIRINNEIESFVSLNFSINEIGKVTGCAIVHNSLNDSTINQDIIEMFKRYRFPSIQNPSHVFDMNCRFLFTPDPDKLYKR